MRAPAISIRLRIMLLLLGFAVLPALLLVGTFATERDALRRTALDRLGDAAAALTDSIDRNLFERYGDVQAFGLNPAAQDPANWRRPGSDNPLVRAIDEYVALYGVYKLALLVSPDGAVLAVNSRDAAGKPVASEPLYGRSFADAPWLGKALRGEFLVGPEGLTGTVVEQPARAAAVAAAYPGEDGYSIVFAAPVKDAAGKVIGVWANFADFGLVEQIVADFHARLVRGGMPQAEITLLDPAGRVIVDYDPALRPGPYRRDFEVIGRLNLAERGVSAAQAAIRGEAGGAVARHARKGIDQANGYARSHGAMGFAGLGWSTLVRVPVEQAFAAVDRILERGLLLVAIVLAAILPLGLWAGASFARPLTALGGCMRRIAAGEVPAAIPGAGRRDEVGGMAAALAVFRDTMAEATAMRAREEAYRAEAAAAKRDALRGMADRLEAETGAAVTRIGNRVSGMAENAEHMAATADTIAAASRSVAGAAGQALQNAETVAAATEELSASVREISMQVSQAAGITRQAAEQGKASEAVIRSLSDSAARVGEVVRLIADIAGRTNLLALNATIEAARAGDAGKGFAVVAGEVKSLAAQTARATDEIGGLVGAIATTTQQAVTTVRDMAASVGRIDATSAAIATAVEQQAAATQDIARTVAETAAAARAVATRIEEVSEATMAAGSRAEEVRIDAGEARDAITALRGTLVEVVRTATPEVDRRTTQRFELPRQVTLDLPGRPRVEAKLLDIGAGGARLSGLAPLPAGTRGRLHLAELGAPVPFASLGDDGRDSTRLRFEPDAPATAALARLLATLAGQQAA
ncbi:methyl-accepting chemotaxis protein [Paracraurococcus ruber]|uniref:Methyl-accepting chemotaxis protein n=1 Tax=Paracraurococcus ruber TaxID=77675 RepID=A0ABS1D2G2_9PROT|nr:methyl-accepting chemotaxis protein [Paracraurococcus ruber]MBK1660457.1 hypothetical protein [Paracraurococcus ruber]TDG19288.1 methyl-accepting chemotaxis protein [Paracraurococcus ruber]